MASVGSVSLIDEAAITADTASAAVTLDNSMVDLVIWSNAVHNSGTSTLDANIEHSPDGGTTWETLKSLTQVTTSDATEVIQLNSSTEHVFPLVRVNVDVGASGSPNYDLEVKLFFRQVN